MKLWPLKALLLEYSSEQHLSRIHFEQNGDTRRWFNDEGEIRLRHAGGHVAHIVYTGYFGNEFVEPIVEMADGMVSTLRPVVQYSDTTAVLGNSPGMRIIVTRWTWANRHNFAAYNVLVKPGFVATGLAAVSLRLGGFINLWTDGKAFENSMNRAVRRPIETGRRESAL